MMNTFKRSAIVAAIVGALAAAAKADVVDFTGAAPGPVAGTSFSSGGLTFSSLTAGRWSLFDLDGLGNIVLRFDVTQSPGKASGVTFTIGQTGGGVFDLNGFDHGVNGAGGQLDGSLPVPFSDTGSVVLDDMFDGISSTNVGFDFEDSMGGAYAYFDNISFDLREQPVPEPDSLALVGAGLAAFGLAAGRNKRRRKAQA